MIIRTEGIGEVKQTPIGDLTIKDTKIKTYPSGRFFVQYLYDGLLEKMAEDMRKNLARGYDNMIITQGAEGSGKSTHVWQICKAYDPDFNLEGGYMYDFEEMKNALQRGDDEGSVFWLDEAINIANKRRWQSKDSVDFTDLLIMMRSRGWCVNMCIPRKEDLDFYVRDHRFRYVVTVAPMGFPNAGFKQRGYFKLDRKNIDTGQLEHIGYGEYPDMDEESKKAYKEIKEKAQLRKFSEISEKKEGYKKKYAEERAKIRGAVLAMHEAGMDRESIKKIFGIESDVTYYQTLKRARDGQD